MPGNVRFAKSSQTNTAIPSRFITGLTQKNYGIEMKYDILSLPQLIKKIQSINNIKKSAITSYNSKTNKFLYNLTTTYIELYRAKATLNLQKEIFKTAQTRYNELKILLSYGRVSKSDMLRAHSDFLTSKMNVQKQQKYIRKRTK